MEGVRDLLAQHTGDQVRRALDANLDALLTLHSEVSLLHLSEDSSVLMFFLLLIRYDVIAKMETFSEDTQFTLAQVGMIS